MAKSIWKRGERMTRLEKKKLRIMSPHPNRGRALYQWKVEGQRIAQQLAKAADKGIIDWADIAEKPEHVPENECPRALILGIQDNSTASEDCAGDETYALPAYEKDDGPLTKEQLDWLYKNTAARPGEPITEAQMAEIQKAMLSSETLGLPEGVNLEDLYLK